MWYFKKSVILIILRKVVAVNVLAFQKMIPWDPGSTWLKIQNWCAWERATGGWDAPGGGFQSVLGCNLRALDTTLQKCFS